MPKYVFSSRLVDADWNSSTVLNGDVARAVSKLKQEINGAIVVYASRQLAGTLMEHELVDELRLMVYPIVLGAGEQLFDGIDDRKPMRLQEARRVGSRLVYLIYEPVQDA